MPLFFVDKDVAPWTIEEDEAKDDIREEPLVSGS